MEKINVKIIPHFKLGGGAGQFNLYIIKLLREIGPIEICGKFKNCYTNNKPNKKSDWFHLLHIPFYSGVSLSAKSFYLLRALLASPCLLIKYISRLISNRIDFSRNLFVLTSSVQIFLIIPLRIFYPKSVFIIIIQEFFELDGFIGLLVKKLLKKYDLVVSISEDWFEYAAYRGFKPTLLLNDFENEFQFAVPNCTASDLLYLGGGGKLKGFDYIINSLAGYRGDFYIKINFLGAYSRSQLKKIKKINNSQYFEINVVGPTRNVNQYIDSTKLLVLPIQHPHFCRPAIEVGLRGKTFIICSHRFINSFAIDEHNCRFSSLSNPTLFMGDMVDLVKSDVHREKLASNNMILAENFIKRQKLHETEFMKKIRAFLHSE